MNPHLIDRGYLKILIKTFYKVNLKGNVFHLPKKMAIRHQLIL